ncbi:Hypothetical predicted protein [Olea europaea subsp. europaea]|uniref:Uncharacterized protein n=1 Tax=Olea europaea subsp. europaea TaxID=158383 RepID=A0A8S0S7X8_OLEEU|nr:Hypothetical predicted protein [Olea europaea subsp. europaea]
MVHRIILIQSGFWSTTSWESSGFLRQRNGISSEICQFTEIRCKHDERRLLSSITPATAVAKAENNAITSASTAPDPTAFYAIFSD